jgi:large subunit ribosomal protein L9
MKVLLIKDVYKLGRAGDVKRVADGFGRNFLIPQGLAVLATPSALMQAKHIRAQADTKRAVLNEEMSSIAEILSKLTLTFSAKAGETGKLYGSITPTMIIEAIKDKTELEINRRQMDFEPLRNLGTHKVNVRLTIDLIPAVTVIVYREGETIEIPEIPQEKNLESEPIMDEVEAEAEATQ